MKLIGYISIIVLLISCNTKSKQEITGEWTHGLGSKHIKNISHPGFLDNSLLIDKDSITIMNYPYSALTRTDYKYENDSIYFTHLIPVKFAVKVTDSTLKLSGENFLYGNQISESQTYEKGSFEPKIISILHEIGYDKTELMKYNFCLQPPLNFEIHKSGISKWTTIDSMPKHPSMEYWVQRLKQHNGSGQFISS